MRFFDSEAFASSYSDVITWNAYGERNEQLIGQALVGRRGQVVVQPSLVTSSTKSKLRGMASK